MRREDCIDGAGLALVVIIAYVALVGASKLAAWGWL